MRAGPVDLPPRWVALSAIMAVVLTFAVIGTSAVMSRSEAATTVHFGFAGDTGGNSRTSAVVAAARNAGVDAFFNLGDMSYNQVTPESAWCSLINASAGTMPYELVTGNHEDNGPDGLIDNFASCLPDRTGGVQGTYPKEYYVDYPAANPLVRFVMISPGLTLGGSTWSYKQGTAHYTWTANAIDGARAAGIPWVVVGMHEYCLSLVNHSCFVSDNLMNLIVSKKVDLYLQAHDHAYSRSKQLALVPPRSNSSFNSSCVADASPSSSYTAGNGTVIATVGSGGLSINSQDHHAGLGALLPDLHGVQQQRHLRVPQGRRLGHSAVGTVRPCVGRQLHGLFHHHPVRRRIAEPVRESVRVVECVGESVCEYVGVVVARDGFAALGVSGGGQLGGQRCRVVHARWRQEPLHRQLAGEGVVPEVRPVVPGGSGGGRCDAAGDHGKQQLERVA